MKIYIVKDNNHNPIDVFLSDDPIKVEIALSGMGQKWVSIEEIDPNNIDTLNGLVFLLTSKEKRITSGIGGTVCRVWKRGV